MTITKSACYLLSRRKLADYFDDSPGCNNEEANTRPFYKYNSSSFVDLNGDCYSDLVFDSVNPEKDDERYLEVWTGSMGSKTMKYCAKNIYRLNKEYGRFSIADFDNDGSLDLIFPHSSPLGPRVVVWLNQADFSDFYYDEDYCTYVRKEGKIQDEIYKPTSEEHVFL